MKLLIFSVHDTMVQAFMPPFSARAQGEAVRMFTDLANDHKTNVGMHPMDFCLYQIGEFDDHAGRIIGLDSPVRIISGLECLNNVIASEAEHSASPKVVQ